MYLSYLLLACALAAATAAPALNEPFRSSRSPRDTIVNYDIVEPVVTNRDSNEPNPKQLEILLSSDTQEFTLQLQLNDMLLAPHFTSRHYDNHDTEVVTKGHINCYYHGKVKGYPEWTAVISTCQGLQGSFGDMEDKTQFYHLEPLDASNNAINQPHALYMESEHQPQTGTCGSKHDHEDTIHLPHLDVNTTDDVMAMVRRRRQTNGFLFMEWVLVNDNRQYQAFGGNLENVVQRSIDLANYVDNLYRPLNIRVVLVGVITWSNGDRISVVSDPETLLDNFENYVPSIPNSYDSAMLITGRNVAGSTVGLAYVGTMCTRSVAIGFTQDGGGALNSVGAIAAHELGHIFNMDHDNSRSCTCNDPTGTCIMSAVSTFPPQTVWSSCSRSDLERGFNTRSTGRCLINEPTSTVGDPVCGNGIVEEDEICDCGSAAECTDPCCNPNTCQLASGAQCSAGPCCTDTCTFKAYGTTCSASRSECDIAEYCPGDSSECPEDTFKQDGIPCGGNTGYCYQGSCPTHELQCKEHFGQGSGKGVSQCYSQFNTRGDQFGNCGHTSSRFLACTSSDVQCGQLHCIPGSFQNNFDVSLTILTVSVFASGSVEQCQSFTTQPGTGGSDFISPGLVQEGTKCGNNQICVDHKCVATSVQSCPVGSNGQVCSGDGICNNDGVCSCNVGLTGSTCETPYNGPGTDECATDNGGCDHVCTNTNGAAICSCNSGFTLAGDGRSCVEDSAPCGGTLTADSGSFQTPNWPQTYPVNIECEWIIELSDSSKTIEFTFDPSEYGLTDNPPTPCERDWVEFFDGVTDSAPSLGRFCHMILPPPVTTTSNEARVKFVAGPSHGSRRRGFRVTYEASEESTDAPVNECLTNNGGCDHICTDTSSGFVCACNSGYTLSSDGRTCTDVNECGTNNGGCSQRCVNQQGSHSCECNLGYVIGSDGRSCNDVNECNTNNGGCSHICSNTQGSFQCSCRSGYELASDSRSCTDVNECSTGNGGCDHVCTNTDGGFSCSCDDGFTLASDGRSCEEDSALCGGTLTADSGSFQTPNWPQTYPVDIECEWIIELSDSSKTIEFTFDPSEYGLTDNPPTPCERDWVEFFDGVGDSAPSLGRFCHKILPPPVTTTSNEARVKFIAGPSHGSRRRGFRVTYEAQEQANNADPCDSAGCEHDCSSTGGSAVCSCRPGFDLASDGTSCEAALCGGTLTADSGSFQTPNWPQTYPVNIECEWVIELSDSSKSIEFTFDPSEYGLTDNPPTPCLRDWVEFFDGVADSAPSLGRFCHKILPPPVTTTSNEARVIFIAGPDHGPRRRGFRVTYESVN